MDAVMDYTITVTDQVVRVDFHAQPTVDMVIEIQAQVASEHPGLRRLYCLGGFKLLLTTAELQEVAAHARSFANQPDRLAIVAEDVVSFEAGRIHRLFRESDGAEEQIFRTVDKAMAWLSE
jgi:hypothetical protein